MSAKETKDKIIKCTTDLILERGGDISNVTIRTIAARAGIGVGLTNHYFESKEQLIEECIEGVFAELFEMLAGESKSAEGPEAPKAPADGLKAPKTDTDDPELDSGLLSRTADRVLEFLIRNEAVAKAALVRDAQNPLDTDYTAKLTDAFAYAMVDKKKLEEIEGNDRMTERMKEQFKQHIINEQKLKAFMIMSSIKEALIRREVLKTGMDIDLKDDGQRSAYIDSLMELLY